MGFYTQLQQCFGKGPTSISPRVDRGDEHLDELAAPLRNSVSSGSFGLSGWSGLFGLSGSSGLSG